MSQLVCVRGTDNDARVGDVVFVHGINGDPRGTWTSPSNVFWPEWVAADCPHLGVWSLGYEAAASGWFGTAMPLVDRATNALDLLDAFGLGGKPMCFITHSMGGLLVKQMLRHAGTLGSAYRRIADATRGVVFLSTPHSGSLLASFLKYFNLVVDGTVALKDLQHGEAHLRELNLWYRNNIRNLNIHSLVFHETRSTRGVLVVDACSADPGLDGVIPVPIDADHLGVCKPESRTAQVYLQINRFLSRLFTEAERDRVEITLDLELEAFGPAAEDVLRYALAGFLKISPDQVRVTAKKRGSVRVTLDLPAPAAERLVTAYRDGDARLWERLTPLPVLEVLPPDPSREEDPHQLFLARLHSIEATIAAICRRHHCRAEEVEDFAAEVKANLLENNCEVLRKFAGNSSFETYLTTIIGRLFLDRRNQLWGKWRPSAEARRLGDVAIKLEELAGDGYTFDESCEILRTNHGVQLSVTELEKLAERLPQRQARRLIGEEQLEGLPSSQPSPDSRLLAKELQEERRRVQDVLARAIARLSDEDRTLLKLRFQHDLQTALLTGGGQVERRRLYRRLERILRRLRRALEREGVLSEAVAELLASRP